MAEKLKMAVLLVHGLFMVYQSLQFSIFTTGRGWPIMAATNGESHRSLTENLFTS